MYPTISDFIYHFFGVYIPLPIQTFGFFMALAFLTGTLWTYYEFSRLEKLGLMQPSMEKRIVGKPANIFEILFNAFIGFILGFKGLAMVMNWVAFSEDPQSFILSGEGSWIGGLLLAGLLGYLRYYEKEKERLPEPKKEEYKVYPHERLGDLVILAAITGVLGAKLFAWFDDWDAFLRDPIGHLLSFNGMAYYGGLICAGLSIAFYVTRKKISVPRIADAAAPALILGYGVGRLGCHFSGDGDWGVANTLERPNWLSFLPDWAWAYHYPNNVVAKLSPGSVECYAEWINPSNIIGREAYKQLGEAASGFYPALCEAVWPTSVYEFVMAFLIFLFLVIIRKSITHIPGLLFAIYFILNGIERFSIEIVRTNDKRAMFGIDLSQAQYIAMILISVGILMAIAAFWFKNRQTPATQ